MMLTMKNLLTIAQMNETPLLSNYGGEFWQHYITNHEYFDKAFTRLYKTFVFYDQEKNDTSDTVFANWIDACYGYLLMNDKRFSEMWRMQGITDEELQMTYNYDMKEVMAKTNNGQSTTTTGQRTDVDNVQIGNQKTENVNKVSAFNTSSESTATAQDGEVGTRNDITQFTKGQETDTSRGQSAENYTLTRKGNIGTQTGADILMSFDRAMPVFNFYMKVFSELCEQFLLIGGDLEC